MRKKGLNSVVNVSICIMIAMALLVVASCKQSEEEAPPEVQKQPSPSTPVISEKPDVPKETPPTTKDTEKVEQPVSKDTHASKWVPIPIKLPKPMFVGTPQDTKVENLEPPRGKPRPHRRPANHRRDRNDNRW
ncbi:MAG: hypothetical protein ACYSYL_16220 [Planctomycetota bacterium]